MTYSISTKQGDNTSENKENLSQIYYGDFRNSLWFLPWGLQKWVAYLCFENPKLYLLSWKEGIENQFFTCQIINGQSNFSCREGAARS